MKKNKLITLILVSAVCVSLILSLCSFTTGLGEPDTVIQLSTPYKVDVKYCYHRVTATLDEYYTGFFKQFNNISVGTNGSSYARASDYVVISNTSFNYQNVTSNSSSGKYGFGFISEDAEVAYFTGDLKFYDFSLSYYDIYENETFSYDYFSFNGIDDDVITITADYQYIDVYGQYIENSLSLPLLSVTSLNMVGNSTSVSIHKLFKYVYDEIVARDNFVTNQGKIYIDSLDISFSDTVLSSMYFTSSCYSSDYSDYNGLYYFLSDWPDIYQNIYDVGRDEGYFEGNEVGYENGYTEGYLDAYDEARELGFNQGVSQAPAIWGGLGEFFTTSVGGFLEFEFFPGFSVSNVLALIVSVGVVIVFLKIFAGG